MKVYWPLVISGSLLMPTVSHALGLGQISVSSALNQPLDAEVALLAIKDLQLDNVQVKLASQKAFEAAGVARPYLLDKLTFSIDKDTKGRPIIRIHSDGRINEPYLQFLVNVTWSGGQLNKLYTVLLDPPEFHVVNDVDTAVLGQKTNTQTAAKPVKKTAEKLAQKATVTDSTLNVSLPTPTQASARQTQATQQMLANMQFPVSKPLRMPTQLLTGTRVNIDTPAKKPNNTKIALHSRKTKTSPGVNINALAAKTNSPVSDSKTQASITKKTRVASNKVAAKKTLRQKPVELATPNTTFSTPLPSRPYIREFMQAVKEPGPVQKTKAQKTKAANVAKNTQHKTRGGESLSRIAKRYKPQNIRLAQAMVAIYQTNPRAFRRGNMNNLKRNVELTIPNATVFRQISPKAARRIVSSQHHAWQKTKVAKLAKKNSTTQPTLSMQAPELSAGDIEQNPMLAIGQGKKDLTIAKATVDKSGTVSDAIHQQMQDFQKNNTALGLALGQRTQPFAAPINQTATRGPQAVGTQLASLDTIAAISGQAIAASGNPPSPLKQHMAMLCLFVALFLGGTSLMLYYLRRRASVDNEALATLTGEESFDSKLDLATAHINMDDHVSAEPLLMAVIENGTNEQKAAAKALAERLNLLS